MVVGGTSGIGHGIAHALAAKRYAVTVIGRTEKGVVAQLPGSDHTFVPMDAFSLASVTSVATASPAPDLLVMTQGMATLQGHTPTADGLDQKLQLHYFSRIHLARLLAPRMPPGARVLTVLSAGVHSAFARAADDFELRQRYSVADAANAAGFYTDAGFEALAEQHPALTVAHAHPGFVNTRWGAEMPWILRAAIRPLQAGFGRSAVRCGEVLTEALLALPEGGYHLIGKDGEAIDKAKGIQHTREERDMIWEKTLALLPGDLQ